jgi:hypothetical protein
MPYQRVVYGNNNTISVAQKHTEWRVLKRRLKG